MTIQEIYERYELPDATQVDSIAQAAFIKEIQKNWVGTQLDWRALVIAALFYDVGSAEQTKHVRKKVGIDKFIVNIMSRAVTARFDEVVTGHDWYQKVLLLSSLYRYQTAQSAMQTNLVAQIEENVIHPINLERVTVESVQAKTLYSLDIKHYKNPSV